MDIWTTDRPIDFGSILQHCAAVIHFNLSNIGINNDCNELLLLTNKRGVQNPMKMSDISFVKTKQN